MYNKQEISMCNTHFEENSLLATEDTESLPSLTDQSAALTAAIADNRTEIYDNCIVFRNFGIEIKCLLNRIESQKY